MSFVANILPIPQKGPVRRLIVSGATLNFGAGLQEILVPFFLIKFCFASIGTAGVVLTLAAAGAVVSVIPAGYLCERFPARVTIVASGVAQFCATLLLIATDSVIVVTVVLVFCTVLAQVGRIARSAMIASMPAEERTIARAQMGVWTNLGIGVGMAATTFVLAVGDRAAFNAGFVVAAISFLLAALLRRRAFAGGGFVPSPHRSSTFREVLRSLTNLGQLGVSTAHFVVYLHQLILTLGISLIVAADPRLPDWLAGLTLVLNLGVVLLGQNIVAKRITSSTMAVKAWALAGVTAGVGCLLIAAVNVSSVNAYLLSGLLIIAILVLSIAELWYVAGEMELSVMFASSDGSAAAQATFLLGRDAAAVVGPACLAFAVASSSLGIWLIASSLFLALSLVFFRWAGARTRMTTNS